MKRKFLRLGLIALLMVTMITPQLFAKKKSASASTGEAVQTDTSDQTKTGSSGSESGISDLGKETGDAASAAMSGGDLSGYSTEALAGALAGADSQETADAIEKELEGRLKKSEDAASTALAKWSVIRDKVEKLEKQIKNLKYTKDAADRKSLQAELDAAQKEADSRWASYMEKNNAWQKDCENLSKALAAVDSVGDPVRLSTGEYVYESADYTACDFLETFEINREYCTGQTGWSSFGKSYNSSLDSRIIRLRSQDFSQYVSELESEIKIYKEAISLIDEYNEEFPSYPQGEEEKLEFEAEITAAENIINKINENSSRNQTVDNQNKYVRYGRFLDLESLIGPYENLIYIDNKGQMIYCRFNGTYWQPVKELTAAKLKIYGLSANGQLSQNSSCEGGYRVSYASGKSVDYDKNGILHSQTDRCGNKILFSSDKGRITEITNKTGEKITITRNSSGFITKISGKISGETLYTYKDNYLSSSKNNRKIETGFVYNNDGTLSSIKRADGSSVKIAYEYVPGFNKNVVSSVTNEENQTEYFIYDYDNKSVIHKTASEIEEFFKYNEGGNIVYQKDEKGLETVFEFSKAGVPVSITTEGRKTVYCYDDKFNIVKKIYPEGGYDSYEYDSFGSITKVTDRDGNFNEYQYDSKGNMKESSYNGNHISSMNYYDNGLLKNLDEKNIFSTLTYDSYGQILTQTKQCGNEKTVETWKYDSTEKISEYKSASGIVTRFTYDESYQDKHNKDAKCKETQIVNKFKNELVYNSRNWLIEQIQTDLISGISYKKNIFYDHKGNVKQIYMNDKLFAEYEYTPYGNLLSYTIWNAQGKGLKSLYTYDKKQRLLTEKRTFVYEDNQVPEESETLISNEYLDKNGGFVMNTGINGQKNYSYEYDSYGNILCITRPDGSYEKRNYSEGGKLLSCLDSMYGSNRFIYNNDGSKEVYYSDMNGKETIWKYDSDGNQIYIKLSDGREKKRSYDWKNNFILEQGEGYEESYEYDEKNRLINRVLLGGDGCIYYESHTEYDDNENSVLFIEGSGRNEIDVSIKMDVWNRPVYVADGDYAYSFEYDCLGNCVKQISNNNEVTSWTYSPTGKVETTVNADGSVYENVYSILDKLIGYYINEKYIAVKDYNMKEKSVTQYDRFGNKSKIQFDNVERILVSYRYDTGSRYYSYNTNGSDCETKVTDEYGNSLLYRFDCAGNLIYEKNQNGAYAQYNYDTTNRIADYTDFEGNTGRYFYDDKNGITTVSWSNGEEYSVCRNCTGKITSVISPEATFNYSYSTAGKLLSVIDEKAGIKIDYNYDNSGRLSEKKSDLFDYQYEYDSSGRNIKTTDIFSGQWIKADYDSVNREIQRTFSNGVTISKSYNKTGSIETVISKEPYGAVIDASLMIYDESGKISATGKNKGNFHHYLYDEAGRLIKSVSPYSDARRTFFFERGGGVRALYFRNC